MNTHTNLTEQQLIQICSKIVLVPPNIIAANKECFNLIPLVYQSFILEFTMPYIVDMYRRTLLHQFASECVQSKLN